MNHSDSVVQDLNTPIEVELLPQTPVTVLQAIALALQEEWGLQAESLSKFERALALLDAAE